MYINHLTLATGHTSRIERGDVAGETLARIAPWLEAGLAAGQSVPLPVSALATYSALLLAQDGASQWPDDLERCIAWAWVTRPSDVEDEQ